MKTINFTSTQVTTKNMLFFKELQIGSLPEHPKIHVMLAYFDQASYQDTLFDEHNITFPDQLQNAVNKRRAEYLAARYCTQQLLNHLGYFGFQVTNAKDRSPIWPDTICGSISHSVNCAIAFIAFCDDNQLIGVDIEQEIKSDTVESVSASIINDAEAALLKNCALTFEQAFTLAFSIKESLFKALYPHVKRFFDFHAAEITSIDCNNRTVNIKLLQTLSDKYQAGSQFHGNFTLMPQQQVLTYIVE
ncbi:4'-phosphopantetheinyl transferase superfamily protein [Xenorhabdus nematophila]|uniref:4'-phosphopantetheinyl transferase family protein n=2 Tax=Xenorhabdus nematophila TaxID=628 RepID=UPI000543171A|nr:4'-phosphopantetheinyl transferase superfamily protein [Xenorhabdus nematophila]CEF30994.1 4'-phosphopantetheinyl tranferase [Xenorhabdus nematophila str. Websteri]AYA40926.1 4'-phosphopantetheinyl transferase superfamily protein [Xenorhabdus nematophila]MBA0019675.1 4'-phosphopantetheinyl transferase superfamily protein [Xenorhabdus nematophila]MCB4426795.1 4'-phosphopantetheinyl transferase superfamily protein [Xenorhabdus nematophila]QNJ35335.1 4'-phosphopantetheinyl transferase superfam